MSEKIVVLGGGESGVGAAILAQIQGYNVFVSDSSIIKDKYKDELNQYSINWEQQQHTKAEILSANRIIKSPGIPLTAPIVKEAIALNIPIISEIEFAAEFSNAKMICITGSNGKTTTASLIFHIMKQAKLNVGLAGNIGYSLARQVALTNHDYYVIELSSFQLDNMYKFKANVAILLNITPDHLDRYEYKFEKYADSKFRITQNQKHEDHFIYWKDDMTIQEGIESRNLLATMHPFTLKDIDFISDRTVHICKSEIVINSELKIPISKLNLIGTHNLLNTMAACTALNILGLSQKDVVEGLQTFHSVEHRLEFVKSLKGIDFINDSKATNIDSCFYALQAMHKKTILILGGVDKGNDYNTLLPLINEKCKVLIFLGKDNNKLINFFSKTEIPYISVDNMKTAVQTAYQKAEAGDVVLLSPCCASFDLFTSYENRGDIFKECVNTL